MVVIVIIIIVVVTIINALPNNNKKTLSNMTSLSLTSQLSNMTSSDKIYK